MQTQRLPIASLRPDPENMRTHPEANLRAIESSLRRWGQQKPIVVDSAGVVRCGNGTLEAARRLGWTEIDVVVSDLSGAELAAFAIADNRTAELAEWSEELAATLARLAQDLPDLDLAEAGMAELTASLETDAKGGAEALADQIEAEEEWSEEDDGAAKRADAITTKVQALRDQRPDLLAGARAVVLSADCPDVLVLADDALADVLAELRRYVDAGVPSPLAELLNRAHRL